MIAGQMANMGKLKQLKDVDPPVLEDGLEIYLQAFHSLDRGRAHNFGPTPIPWSEIQYYSEAHEFDSRQTDFLHFFMIKLDEYELDRVRKEQKRQAAKGKGK